MTGTPIRDVASDRPRAPRARGSDWPDDAVSADLRRVAGRAPVQRGGRRGAAAARRARAGHPRHRRGRLRRRARRPRGLPGGPSARATGRTRSCATRCCRAGAADLVVGRAGSSTLAEVTALGLPMVVVPYPHAAGHQRGERAELVEAGAARLVEDEAFDAEALLGRGRPARRPAAARRDGRGRARARPAGAADAVADLVLALAAAAPVPGPAEIERLARGPRVTRARPSPRAFDAVATGTEIQRRIGVKTSRDEPLARFTTMRVGGPADLFATVHNAFELRALVRFARRARSRSRCWGGGATSSSPTPGSAASSSRSGPRARGRRRALHRRGRRADGPRRDRDPEGRPDRARVRAGDPGHGRRRGLGQRRAPTRRDVAGVLESADVLARRRHRGGRAGRRARLRVPRQPVQAAGAAGRRASSSARRSA